MERAFECLRGASSIGDVFSDVVDPLVSEQKKSKLLMQLATGAGKRRKEEKQKEFAWLATGREGKLYLHFFESTRTSHSRSGDPAPHSHEMVTRTS